MMTNTNESAASARPAAPSVGDGATYTLYTDRTACTVIAVSKSGREVTIQADKAELLNGVNSGEPDALVFHPGGYCGHMEGQQRYAYTPDPQGTTYRVSLRQRRTGEWIWKLVGDAVNSPGSYARMGRRSHHYDYNF